MVSFFEGDKQKTSVLKPVTQLPFIFTGFNASLTKMVACQDVSSRGNSLQMSTIG